MTTIHDFDAFLENLQARINKYPEHKEAIVRQAMKESGCPYLDKKTRK